MYLCRIRAAYRTMTGMDTKKDLMNLPAVSGFCLKFLCRRSQGLSNVCSLLIAGKRMYYAARD